MKTTYILFSLPAILWALAVSPAAAKDDPLEFVHLLQKEGYGDVAVDYLDQLKTDPNTPKAILDVWDLEMSRSKKEKAKRAYSDAEAKQLTEDSKTLLDRFIKTHPGLPEAIQEAARWAEERAMEGQYLVLRAGYATDKEAKAKLLADARKLFETIRPRFVDALKASIKLRDSLGPKTPRRKRDDATVMVGENRLTVAMVDFYLAQTLGTGSDRTAALTRCIKEFDAIYQDFREASEDARKTFLGCRAHFWNGRIVQELGQTSDAKAIYEEVAAYDPRNIADVNETAVAAQKKALKKTGLEEFFADVEQYYLQTLYQLSDKKDYKDYLEEAGSWRTAHKANSERCYGYQALTLDIAKNLVEMGNQPKADKALRTKQALALLGQMAKIPSPYQEDAVELRRKLNPNLSAEEGFEDAAIDGDKAWDEKKWAEAIKCYEKAIAAATKNTDQQRLAAVVNAVVACYHNQAKQLYEDHKADDAIAFAKQALQKPGNLKTKAAPALAIFVLNVQYYQYLEAAEGTDAQKTAKSELLAKVAKTAKAILNNWAAREEGDAARIVLMRLALAQENMADADKFLSEINPSSKEYPKALTVMGFAHWYKYHKLAKKQIQADIEEQHIKIDKLTLEHMTIEQLADLITEQHAKIAKDKLAKCKEDRRQALEFTEKAVAALKPSTADAVIPESLRESQLLLAEIYKEGEDFKKSAELYKPLIDDMLKEADKLFADPQRAETTLRIFDGACQVYLQLDDIQNLTTVCTKLMELGPDQGQINLTIMNVAKRLEPLRKKALAEGDSGDPAAAKTAKPLVDLQEKVLMNLAKRENISPASLVWIAKTASNVGTDDALKTAADLVEKISDMITNKQGFADDPVVIKAEASLHALGANLQAQLGNYEKAQEQIDAVIRKYPKVLDPRVTEAKILTEWAAKKDPSKYREAIGKWDTLRNKLENYKPNPPPKVHPKYEVILNEADCFYRMAQKTKSKDDATSAAKKGMDVLRPYLDFDDVIRNPNDDYKDLSARYYQVGGKLAEFLGAAKPVRPPRPKRTR